MKRRGAAADLRSQAGPDLSIWKMFFTQILTCATSKFVECEACWEVGLPSANPNGNYGQHIGDTSIPDVEPNHRFTFSYSVSTFCPRSVLATALEEDQLVELLAAGAFCYWEKARIYQNC